MIVDRLGNPLIKDQLVVYVTRGIGELTLGILTGEVKDGDKTFHPTKGHRSDVLIAVREIDYKTFKPAGRKTWRRPTEFMVYFYIYGS